MRHNSEFEKVTMDKSGANKVAIDQINAGREIQIKVRQIKYLNNIMGQDHLAIKRMTRPRLNFKSVRSARNMLAGVELMHMMRKGQMIAAKEKQDAFCGAILCVGRIDPPSFKGRFVRSKYAFLRLMRQNLKSMPKLKTTLKIKRPSLPRLHFKLLQPRFPRQFFSQRYG